MWIGVGCPCSHVHNDIVMVHHLLFADTQLFKRLLLSDGPSVGSSVCWAINTRRKVKKSIIDVYLSVCVGG